MTPLLVALAGVVALGVGFAVLRLLGPAYRVGRLIAATPRISVAEALEIAASGRPAYVAVAGRIDSETPFEGPDHQPLVFRRTRREALREGGWWTFDDRRDQVAFEIHEGLDAIGVDGDGLDVGLVVVPRIASGTAADLPGEVPTEVDADAPVRIRIEQVSAVEHALVLGVPRAGRPADGTTDAPADGPAAHLASGLGRPLILTTLEPAEAMRILSADRPVVPRIAAGALILGALLIGLAVVWSIATWLGGAVASAATPTPGSGGDPRSGGEGPGLVGEPVVAVLGVLGIAILALLLVQGYVVLSGGRRR